MSLDERQVRQFWDDGFLIVADVFTRDELQPAMDELAEMVDRFVERLHAAGRISNRHRDMDLHSRLIAIDKEFPGAAMLFMLKTELGPDLARLWSSSKLLDIVEQFIGPDVAGHPIFAIRSKVPSTRLLTVPWHQDTAYYLADSELTDQITCWVPFEDVDVENGCMQYLRGGHKSKKVFLHHIEGQVENRGSPYLYIAEEDLPPGEIVTCKMRLGSVIFHIQHAPHRSLENHSDRIRWSVDYRYQRPGLPTGLEGDSWMLLPMRRRGDASFRPDIDGWIADRKRKRRADYFNQAGVDEFDIDVTGTDRTMARWVKTDAPS